MNEEDFRPNPEVVNDFVDYLLKDSVRKYLEEHTDQVREIDMMMVGLYFHRNLVHDLATRWDKRNPGTLNNTLKAADLAFRKAMRDLRL